MARLGYKDESYGQTRIQRWITWLDQDTILIIWLDQDTWMDYMARLGYKDGKYE